MRCLFIHARDFSYVARKKSDIGRSQSEITMSDELADCTVVKCSISPEDDEDTVDRMLGSLVDYSQDVDTKNIVIFPYAHLFEELAEPEKALFLLDYLEQQSSEEFDRISRVPFGWYKDYKIESTGHPLSAASREF
jgi:threonyl-tRNA synthetase